MVDPYLAVGGGNDGHPVASAYNSEGRLINARVARFAYSPMGEHLSHALSGDPFLLLENQILITAMASTSSLALASRPATITVELEGGAPANVACRTLS
jgi:hypothetical protein